jgi:heat shock protein HslJ
MKTRLYRKHLFAVALLACLAIFGIPGCASVDGGNSSPVPASRLTNTYWKLIRLNNSPIAADQGQREAHLILQEKDRRVAGSGGCNRIMGSYQLDGSRISFGKTASTMMACINMRNELVFLGTLDKIKGWTIDGNRLDLLDDAGQVLASFDAVALQ